MKLAASVHQGKQERSKLTITDAERKLLSQQFDSDSSKSESDWESSSDDDYDNDNENENTKRLMSFSLPLKSALPSLTLPQTDNIRTNLAERDSPRTRKFGKVYFSPLKISTQLLTNMDSLHFSFLYSFYSFSLSTFFLLMLIIKSDPTPKDVSFVNFIKNGNSN